MSEDYSQGWIDLGVIDPKEFIRTVHELSAAQGMGFLHDSPNALTDEEMAPWIEQLEQSGSTRLDYVKGRSAKMSIHKHEGHYFIRKGSWYDHTDEQLQTLLAKFGALQESKKHSTSCACEDCQPNNPMRNRDKALKHCGMDKYPSIAQTMGDNNN